MFIVMNINIFKSLACLCSIIRSKDEIEAYRFSKEITVRGKNTPNPVTSFEEAGFPDYVLKEIRY